MRNDPAAVRTTAATAWQECPKINSGLVLSSDSWCSFLTAGIFRPALETLMPSARKTGRPRLRSSTESIRSRTARVQSAASRSGSAAALWNIARNPA